MYGSEVFVFLLSLFGILIGSGVHSTSRMHGLYFRGNLAPGIVRLGLIAAMAWIAFVLAFFADPSVVGVYVLFYLVLGFAAVKWFGQTGAQALGLRTRTDIVERRNVPAALVAAAFILATGLIFGGSLWGEADPTGDDEGGWWIPVGFFLMGWFALLLAFALFRSRERRTLAHRLRRERSMADAKATAAFLIAAGAALADAVAGDFYGWRHGLITFGVLAGLLILHEAFAVVARSREETSEARRTAEAVAYLGLGALAWFGFRVLDLALR